MKKGFIFTLLFIFVLVSCKKGNDIEWESHDYYSSEDYALISAKLNLPNGPTDYSIFFPEYANNTSIQFQNGLTTLGRVLFYDVNLSQDRSISCGSCHKQNLAFADDVAFSVGNNEILTKRNSLALGAVFSFNEYYGSPSQNRVPFFWDNSVDNATEQASKTFASNEMEMDNVLIVERVKEQAMYQPLFNAAFEPTDQDAKDVEITDEKIYEAVAEFINSIGSYESKFDTGLDEYYNKHGFVRDTDPELGTEDFSNFSAQENLGKRLFVQNCSNCHGAMGGVPQEFAANNGLDMEYTDGGVGEHDSSYENVGLFKVPTLRNIPFTAPYMHDGRFETLEEVLDHYSTGIVRHPNLHPKLMINGQARKFNFSEEDKQAIIAFLETMNDDNILTAEKYADPFK